MDGMVEAPVAAQRQPVNLPLPRGHPGRGGAVAGGEMVPAGEPGHGDDVADDGGGDDRPDAEIVFSASQQSSPRHRRTGALSTGVSPGGHAMITRLEHL